MTLKLRVLPRIPSSIVAGDGVLVSYAGGVYTLAIDPTAIPALDADLAAIAGLTSAADKGIQFTGVGQAGTYTLTAYAKTLLDDVNAGAALSTLGVSSFIQTVIDDADAGTARTTLGAAASGANTDITSLAGTATNDSAAAGKIGEYLSANIAIGSETALTTATALSLTSITLTAGDWDVSAECYFLGTGTTNFTSMIASISTTNNTLDQFAGRFSQWFGVSGFVPGSGGRQSFTVLPNRFSVTGSTPVYLVALASFTASTAGASGIIRARRVR